MTNQRPKEGRRVQQTVATYAFVVPIMISAGIMNGSKQVSATITVMKILHISF
jgi:hypothetical protein